VDDLQSPLTAKLDAEMREFDAAAKQKMKRSMVTHTAVRENASSLQATQCS